MKYTHLSLIACLPFLLSSCLQWDLDEKAFPTVSINEIERTSCISAIAHGSINDQSLASITTVGHVWSSTNPSPTLEINEGMVEQPVSDENFSSSLEFPQPFTTYYIAAFIVTEFGVIYSDNVLTVNTSWYQHPGFPGGGKNNGVAFVIGNYAYVGLGDNDISRIFRRYNALTGAWDKIIGEPFPGTPRCCATAFSIGGKGYVGAGGTNIYTPNPTYYSDFYKFDPTLEDSNPWQRIDSLPAGEGRYWAVTFIIEDRAYIGGGPSESAGLSTSFFRLGQNGVSWEPIESLPIQVVDSGETMIAAFSAQNNGYIILRKKDVWQYLPELRTWEKRPEMKFPGEGSRTRMFAWPFPDKAYGGFGLDDEGDFFYYGDLWEFDPENPNYWTEVEMAYPEGRNASMTFTIDGKGYMVGGCFLGNCLVDEFWEFCSR